jgi:hypothetical protein
LIELCFQTAGLWEMAVHHRMGLPRHVDRISFYAAPDCIAAPPQFAIVNADGDGGSFAADVIDGAGTLYLRISGYRTISFREDVDARVFQPEEAVVVA